MGFDVFIDNNLKAWVLEINDHPSLNINLCLEGDKGLIKEPSEVDRYIKVKVIGDAIKLMRKHKERSQIDAYKCWHRLLPSECESELGCFMAAKDIYSRLLAGKLQSNMTLSGFCKLAKVSGLGYQKVQLELLHKKLTKSGAMDMSVFFDALQEIGQSVFKGDREAFAKVVLLIN